MAGRDLILNLVIRAQGSHAGGWRFSRTQARDALTLDYYRHIVATAERGLFDMAFVTDTVALSPDPVEALQWPLDPLVLMAALAGVTHDIGLIVTHSTTFNTPFNTARFFASLDHLSGGRAGWNVVTSSQDAAARNFGLAAIPEHDGRYAKAAEYLDAALALWQSWGPDAVVGDKAGGRLVDTAAIRRTDFDGEHFRVQGPLNTARSPQVVPLISQAGASGPGRDLAARYADIVYAYHASLTDAKAYADDLRARAVAQGRDPASLLLLPGIVPYIRSTEAEARKLTEELFALDAPDKQIMRASELLGVDIIPTALDRRIDWQAIEESRPRWGNIAKVERVLAAKDTPDAPETLRQLVMRLDLRFQHRALVGTPSRAADYIEEGYRSGAFDGASIIPPVLPEGIEDFVDQVVPILQSRGIHKRSYASGTLREKLRLPCRAHAAAGAPHYA